MLDDQGSVLMNRQEFLSQIHAHIGLPVVIMGFFDKSKGTMISVWQTRSRTCPPDAYRDIVTKAEQVLRVQATLTPSTGAAGGHAGGHTAGGAQNPRRMLRLKTESYNVIVGPAVADIFPVMAYPQLQVPDSPVRDAALSIGMSYVRQQLVESIDVKPAWPDGLVESTLKALSLRFLMLTDKAEIRMDGRLSETATDDSPDWVVLNGRLCLRDDTQNQNLHDAIAKAAGPERQTSIVAVSTASDVMRLVVVAPMEGAETGMALVVFEHAQTNHAVLREHFFRAHGLTRSEQRIAHVLLDGGTLNDAAASTSLSIATVRSYMKCVFIKTGTHRQSELIALYYKSILPVGASIANAELARPH